MTRLIQTASTERIGLTVVEKICARAQMIFREQSVQDVGIDGLIEIVEDGIATGIYVGVQIKTGKSFISKDGALFTFRANRAHFGYWARCAFLVIGVVIDPRSESAVWINLSNESTDDRIINGPYSIRIRFSTRTEFSVATLKDIVAKLASQYVRQRRTLEDIRNLLTAETHDSDLSVPNLDVSPERKTAWRKLIGIFINPDADTKEVGNSGYRLSWYYPSVTEEQKNELHSALRELSDKALLNILRAVSELVFSEATVPAELIGDLLSYIPGIGQRIECLLDEDRIAPRCVWVAIQMVEYLEQNTRSDLWDKYKDANST